MSGTSLDGIDAVCCAFEEGRWHSVVDVSRAEWASATQRQLLGLQQGTHALTAREWAALDQAVSDAYLEALMPLLKRTPQVLGMGLHGQTVFHDAEQLKTSLQLCNPHWIAARTGCLVVHDFRRADMALGGQGAPLVPAFHQMLFAHQHERRAVVNIGGISNLTQLLPGSSALAGYDVGPGNGLMDEWVQINLGQPFDTNGTWARNGQLIEPLLSCCLAHEWFQRPPPKSTGRDFFSLAWMDTVAPGWRQHPAADAQRTLLELTARSIATAAEGCERLLVCGGGALNIMLLERLRAQLPTAIVESTAAHGLDPQQVEAAAFAWLAQQRYLEAAGPWHLATGASAAARLGSISLPPVAG